VNALRSNFTSRRWASRAAISGSLVGGLVARMSSIGSTRPRTHVMGPHPVGDGPGEVRLSAAVIQLASTCRRSLMFVKSASFAPRARAGTGVLRRGVVHIGAAARNHRVGRVRQSF